MGDFGLAPLFAVAHRVVNSHLRVQPGETVAIVSDTCTAQSVVAALMGAVTAAGAEPLALTINRREREQPEPPVALTAALKTADVLIMPTSTSLVHTHAMTEIRGTGARGIMKAPHAERAWLADSMQADAAGIRQKAEILAGLLRSARTARLVAPNGTDISMEIGGRNVVGWLSGVCVNGGELSTLPPAECSLPPREGSAEGRVVVEIAFTTLGGLSAPLVLDVRGGEVHSVTGGPEAARLSEILATVENARNVAELGIGLNPKAMLAPDIYECKKRLGTAHIGLGDNAGFGYGGVVHSRVHMDGLVPQITLYLDGKPVIADGQLRF